MCWQVCCVRDIAPPRFDNPNTGATVAHGRIQSATTCGVQAVRHLLVAKDSNSILKRDRFEELWRDDYDGQLRVQWHAPELERTCLFCRTRECGRCGDGNLSKCQKNCHFFAAGSLQASLVLGRVGHCCWRSILIFCTRKRTPTKKNNGTKSTLPAYHFLSFVFVFFNLSLGGGGRRGRRHGAQAQLQA